MLNIHNLSSVVDNLAALFAGAESETRPVDPEYAAGQITMFSDGYPFMLLSQVIRHYEPVMYIIFL